MKNRFLIILSLFVIASSLIIISIQPISKPASTLLPTFNPELAEVPTPTPVSWQTYRNEKYNYTFEYPSVSFIHAYTAPALALKEKEENEVNLFFPTSNQIIKIDSTNFSQKTLSEIYKLKQSNVKIDNLPTYFEYDEDEGGGVYNTYYFIKNKNIFNITTIDYSHVNDDLMLKTISTFKFTDNASKQ